MYDSSLTPLRMARLSRGLPQFLLAKRARLAASRLSVLERGYDEPSDVERAALARVLALPDDQLFPAVPPLTALDPAAAASI